MRHVRRNKELLVLCFTFRTCLTL
ncbi:hypothetical protein Gotri_012545 [Gossypium trilobum]|uniref:Uncharacterized protein n=1 Tax=Gossypium trilobum TaxID=34281 RepID=A0A7J9DRM6_9ROSI|nr:hypothetical protein [Gossypium trilobum]